jgi:hypothetical protein
MEHHRSCREGAFCRATRRAATVIGAVEAAFQKLTEPREIMELWSEFASLQAFYRRHSSLYLFAGW